MLYEMSLPFVTFLLASVAFACSRSPRHGDPDFVGSWAHSNSSRPKPRTRESVARAPPPTQRAMGKRALT